MVQVTVTIITRMHLKNGECEVGHVLQASVFGSDWISKLSASFASAGLFLHQERWPHGLRSRQDRTYRSFTKHVSQIIFCHLIPSELSGSVVHHLLCLCSGVQTTKF